MASNLETLTDLCTPWCIHVAVTLRIADQIAAGAGSVGELARATHCDEYALHAMLGHLASKGVFDEPQPGTFALNETSRALLEPAARLSLDLEGIGGRMAHAWGTMLKYVRTGAPAYQDTFGLPFWEDLDKHPEIGESFDEMMGPAGHGASDPDIAIADGWDGIRSVVDVGGGTGAMLAAILQAHPGVTGTLVDLPRAAARSAETFRAAGVQDRAEVVAQSFFDPLPAGADLYLLKKVVNDWPDRETVAILMRCADAARPNGRVVVLAGVGPERQSPRLTIEMVLVGGRHRTVTEFRDLAHSSGLEVVAAGRPEGSRYFVVECRPMGDAAPAASET